MGEQPIVQKFRAMAEGLKSNPSINVVRCVFNPPATEDELDGARREFDLTPAMLDFYSRANGLSIQWERRGAKEIPRGGLAAGYIELLPVEEVFGDWKGVIYFDEDDEYRPLRPFDFFVEEACAALYVDGSADPEVYYHYLGEEARGLGVNFEGYLELLLKSRGFWYWQRAVAAPDPRQPDARMSVEEANFREFMPQLFPDFDPAAFRRAGRR